MDEQLRPGEVRVEVPESVMVHAREVVEWKDWIRRISFSLVGVGLLHAYACVRTLDGNPVPHEFELTSYIMMGLLAAAGGVCVRRGTRAHREYERAEAHWLINREIELLEAAERARRERGD